MWAIWIAVAGAALAGFYAMTPTSNVANGPPDMSLALAGDMALYRDQLDRFVASHPTANGAIAPAEFVQNSDWTYTPQRWQNFVVNGVVIVYPALGGVPLPSSFAAALQVQAQNSVEAGVVRNGQIVNPMDTGNGITLPAGLPSISNGTPIWIAQVF